jgi:methyl-accepting chemotaxis protein
MPSTADVEIQRYRDLVATLRDVCRRASQGDLSARILDAKAFGALAQVAVDLNRLLDLTELFVTESVASSRSVADGKRHRAFIARGLPGRFGIAAEAIRQAQLAPLVGNDDRRAAA